MRISVRVNSFIASERCKPLNNQFLMIKRRFVFAFEVRAVSMFNVYFDPKI